MKGNDEGLVEEGKLWALACKEEQLRVFQEATCLFELMLGAMLFYESWSFKMDGKDRRLRHSKINRML